MSIWPDFLQEEIRTMTSEEYHKRFCQEPTEEEMDAARERALEWYHQEIEDEHGNVYQPWVKSK